jgi:predicted Zn-dependent protease
VKDPRALETIERAYKLKPDNPAVADTLGWMLVEQGNLRRGLELLQNAVAAAPDAHEIRYHLAYALAQLGEKVQAITHLERIVPADEKFAQRADALALLKQLKN